MSNLSEEQLAVANLIISTLNLEDIQADEIDADEPLFRDGLGLDSIDALELSLAIKQEYGVQLRSDNENVKAIFASLRALTEYIQANR